MGRRLPGRVAPGGNCERGHDRAAVDGAPCHRGRRRRHGAGGRRGVLSCGRVGAAVPRYPGGAISPAAVRPTGRIHRRDGARTAGGPNLLKLVPRLSLWSLGRSGLRWTHDPSLRHRRLAIRKAEHLNLISTAAGAQQIAMRNVRLEINLLASLVNDSLHVFPCGLACCVSVSLRSLISLLGRGGTRNA